MNFGICAMTYSSSAGTAYRSTLGFNADSISSPRYSLKLRRKALGLLLALIKPIDARSTFLLESNFMILLASFELESCKDTVVQRHSADVVALYESYHELPCKCAVCLANLRVSSFSSSMCISTDPFYHEVQAPHMGQRNHCAIRPVPRQKKPRDSYE